MNIPRLERADSDLEMGSSFRSHEVQSRVIWLPTVMTGEPFKLRMGNIEQQKAAQAAQRGFCDWLVGYFVWKRATDMNLTALPVKRLGSATASPDWKPAV